MTAQERDYGDILSRALHSAVDPVEPSPGGLSEIRRRLAEPWLVRRFRLLLSDCRDLAWLIATRLRPAAAGARALPGPATAGARDQAWAVSLPGPGPVAARARRLLRLPGPGGPGQRRTKPPAHRAAHRARVPADGGRSRRQTQTGLHPALIVASVIVVITAGYLAVGKLRSGVSEIGLITGSGINPPSLTVPSAIAHPEGRGHHPLSRHQHQLGLPTPVPVASSPSPSPSCIAVPAASPSPTAHASPTPSGTPTGSPTPTPSGSPTPSASPTASTPAPEPSHSSAPTITAKASPSAKHHHRRHQCAQPGPLATPSATRS